MIVVNSKRPHKFLYVLFIYSYCSIVFLWKIENEVHNNNIFKCKCNNEVRLDQFLNYKKVIFLLRSTISIYNKREDERDQNHSIIGNSTLHATPFKNKIFRFDEMK